MAVFSGSNGEPAKLTSEAPYAAPELVTLRAEPEPLEIDLRKTAVLVIDMQNAFLSKGGMTDLLGLWSPEKRTIIEPNGKIINAAREKGVRVIYVQNAKPPELVTSEGRDSPVWHKDMASRVARSKPDSRDKLNILGTWGAEIVKELKPQKGELVLLKMRTSAFFQTNLDTILKTWGIRHLIFTGTATNVCVEASLIDAFNHFYFPILVSDATSQGGPPSNQAATEWKVKVVYGWVTNTQNVLEALR